MRLVTTDKGPVTLIKEHQGQRTTLTAYDEEHAVTYMRMLCPLRRRMLGNFSTRKTFQKRRERFTRQFKRENPTKPCTACVGPMANIGGSCIGKFRYGAQAVTF